MAKMNLQPHWHLLKFFLFFSFILSTSAQTFNCYLIPANLPFFPLASAVESAEYSHIQYQNYSPNGIGYFSVYSDGDVSICAYGTSDATVNGVIVANAVRAIRGACTVEGKVGGHVVNPSPQDGLYFVVIVESGGPCG